MRAAPPRRLRARLALLALAAVAAAMSTSAQDRDHARRGDLAARLQASLAGIRSQGSLPGVVAAVARPEGELVRVSTGFSDLELHTPMPRDAVMPAGSIGKQFLAMMALALEHDGRVDLDVPIGRWLSDRPWFARVPNASALTLRMLLAHRAGLPDHRDDPRFHADVKQRFARRPYDPDFRLTPEELIGYILDAPPLFAPGAGFKYSETGYILAGVALERACGCVYYDELVQRFLKPLKLTATAPATGRVHARLVQGYIGSRIPEFPGRTLEHGKLRFSPATEWTGGGLFSSAGDLARWSALLYEGRAAPWPYLDELLAGAGGTSMPRTPGEAAGRPAPSVDSYGLGVRIWSTELGPAYGHGGEFPGYFSFAIYFVKYRTAVALQTNTAASSADSLKDAATALMRTLIEASCGRGNHSGAPGCAS
jgi:D-alanyl-D-alanine carboxypeptidase